MTPREILAAAYSRSKRNKGASDIDEPTEGLRVVQYALDRLYTLTARVNPEYFLTDLVVSVNAGKWALPTKVESILRVERALDKIEVFVVPFDDRKLYDGIAPAVYFSGRGYKGAGNPLDPTIEDLNFFYAPGAPVVTIDGAIPETQWPAQHNDLLVDEAAVYLSLKDVRIGEDLPILKGERNNKAVLYIAHLEHVNRTQARRVGAIPQVVGASIVDVLALLAGNGGGA